MAIINASHYHLTLPYKVFKRAMGSLHYVQRMKLLQELKDNNHLNNHLQNGQFVYFFKNSVLVKNEPNANNCAVWASYEDTHHLFTKFKKRLNFEENSVLLNVDNHGRPLLAISLKEFEQESLPVLEQIHNGYFTDMRAILTLMRSADVPHISKASSLLNWHRQNQYCSQCGNRTQRTVSGQTRICTNCRSCHYPKVSPVVIMVVSYNDRCLLVRQPRHPKKMFTAVAGFIDVGETVDDAVKREVAEEVGLDVDTIEFVDSQHWPYPNSSLMLGCLTTVKSAADVVLDHNELEEAKWFTVTEVRNILQKVKANPAVVLDKKRNFIVFPPPGPLAHFLIEKWVDKYN